MNAIIRKKTDDGVKMSKIDNVGMVKYGKIYSAVSGKWREEVELWTHSVSPHSTIILDAKTQIILEGDKNIENYKL